MNTKICPQCNEVNPIQASSCPRCGRQFKTTAPLNNLPNDPKTIIGSFSPNIRQQNFNQPVKQRPLNYQQPNFQQPNFQQPNLIQPNFQQPPRNQFNQIPGQINSLSNNAGALKYSKMAIASLAIGIVTIFSVVSIITFLKVLHAGGALIVGIVLLTVVLGLLMSLTGSILGLASQFTKNMKKGIGVAGLIINVLFFLFILFDFLIENARKF